MSATNPPSDSTAASELDDVFHSAKSLEADDRLRLIARLWASLPAEHWAAPSEQELALIEQRLNDIDTDGLAEVPWKIIRQMAAERARLGAPGKIYSAPRRFDLATIFVVTFAYSILFTFFSWLNAQPEVSVACGGFITIVGAGQALLFGGKKPRAASIITGSVTYVLIAFAYWIYEDRLRSDETIIMVLLMSLIFGGISGYVAGVLVGGVFLVADAVRAAWRWRRNELLEAAAADTPLYSSLRAEQRESRNLVANGDSSVDEPPSG